MLVSSMRAVGFLLLLLLVRTRISEELLSENELAASAISVHHENEACDNMWGCRGYWERRRWIANTSYLTRQMDSHLFDLKPGYKWAVFFGDSNTRMLHSALTRELCTREDVACTIFFPYSPPVTKPIKRGSSLPSEFKNNYKNPIRESLGIFNEDHDVLVTRPVRNRRSKAIVIGHLRLSFRMFTGSPSDASVLLDTHKLHCFGLNTTVRPGLCSIGKGVNDNNGKAYLPRQWNSTRLPDTLFASDTLWKLFHQNSSSNFVNTGVDKLFQQLKDLSNSKVAFQSPSNSNRWKANNQHNNSITSKFFKDSETTIRIIWIPFYHIRWSILKQSNYAKFIAFTKNMTIPVRVYKSWVADANRVRIAYARKYGFRVLNVTQMADLMDLYVDTYYPGLLQKISGDDYQTLREMLSEDGIHQTKSFYSHAARHLLHTFQLCDNQ